MGFAERWVQMNTFANVTQIYSDGKLVDEEPDPSGKILL